MGLHEEIKRNKKNQNPKNVIKLLESYGFIFKRSRGDHYYYKRKGFRVIPIPISQNPLAIHIVQEALNEVEIIIELEGKQNE